MIPDILKDNFALLADTPGGVQQLRELVLQLAVRGVLVAQDPKEQCDPDFRTTEPDEFPHSAPASWKWANIGDTMDMVNGRAFKPSDWGKSGLPIIRIQNLNNENAPFNYCGLKIEERHLIRDGDFLISWSGTPGTSFGAFIWNRGPAVLNQHIFRCKLRRGYDKRYLQLAVNAELDEMISRAHGGVGLRHITKGKLESMFITLPPLAEQKRIVAKVDELMALCDELEARQEEAKKVQVRLNQSALARLTESTELSKHWKNAARNFQCLEKTPENVSNLRKTILQFAVAGHLSDLENRKWEWTELQQCVEFGPTNGLSLRAVSFTTPTKVLTLTATTSGQFLPQHFKYIDFAVNQDSDLWLRDGDILIQRGNSLEYVGIAAVYRGAAHQFIYPDLMMKVRVSSRVLPEFAHLVLISPTGRQYFQSKATGTSGSMPKINQSVVKAFPIPVPPLAEQKRIVAKVGELMKLCDELEAQLERAEADGARLFESIIAGLTAG